MQAGPVFCLLLGVSWDYAQPITGQVTEVTWPVIGQAQPELTPSKRQKTGPDLHRQANHPGSQLGVPHWYPIIFPKSLQLTWKIRASCYMKTTFPAIQIPVIKIRSPWDHLIYIMGFHMLERWHNYTKTAHLYQNSPRVLFQYKYSVLPEHKISLRVEDNLLYSSIGFSILVRLHLHIATGLKSW